MAKVPFTKLNLSRNNEIKTLEWKDQKIEVKQYLPISEKLELIGRIINESIDDNAFYNPCKVDIVQLIETIFTYTNISITEKQSEDLLKIYDLFISSGLAKKINNIIPIDELEYIKIGVQASIAEIYRYRDSAMGIMEQIASDKQIAEEDLTNIITTIKESEELKNLQELTTKLG